jgi:acetoin utilization deacetylase AcuC-like enzyme
MRHHKIKTFYSPRMVPAKVTGSYSMSPSKPRLFMEHLDALGLGHLLDRDEAFRPFDNDDFMVAHTADYVDAFFGGVQPRCESNHIPWSADFARTVRYTNGSLYAAVTHALAHPDQVALSPTSGFHHARPDNGAGFCTFSGQVIASVKAYRETGAVGAYLDLDGHFGNSIEDARQFVPDLNAAVPPGMNINPHFRGSRYLADLAQDLERLRAAVLAGTVDYVVWCHGADSHSGDDLGGGQCDTFNWVECSRMFFEWVKELDAARGRPLPVVFSLFGGYRKDHYESVLELHAADLTACTSILLGVGALHVPVVTDLFAYEEYVPKP